MRDIKSLLLTSLLLFGASPSLADESMFRVHLPSPILLTDAIRMDVTETAIERFVYDGAPVSGGYSISGGKPPYKVELSGSVPPLVTGTPQGLSGTITAGSYSFVATISDSAVPPQVVSTETPWVVEAAHPITVASTPLAAANVFNQLNVPLPAVTGGTAPFSYAIVPETAGVEVKNGRIEILAVSEMQTQVRIEVTDARGRKAEGNPFDVRVTDPAPVSVNNNLVASVTGGTPVKGAKDRIDATGGGYSGGVQSLPALRLNVGESAVVTYSQRVTATRVGVSAMHNQSVCNIPSALFAGGNPKLLVETSLDGVTWHTHTAASNALTHPSGGCYLSMETALDASFGTFRMLRMTVVEATSQTGGTLAVDFLVLRAF